MENRGIIVDTERGRIRISRDVDDAIGNPDFICLMADDITMSIFAEDGPPKKSGRISRGKAIELYNKDTVKWICDTYGLEYSGKYMFDADILKDMYGNPMVCLNVGLPVVNKDEEVNTLMKYRNNFNGISISKGYGRIDVAKQLMDYLGYPKDVTIAQEDEDWMIVYPGSINLKNGLSATIEHHATSNGSHQFCINDKELVLKIFNDYDIHRNDENQFSPFYMINYRTLDETPYVEICMNHFTDYLMN